MARDGDGPERNDLFRDLARADALLGLVYTSIEGWRPSRPAPPRRSAPVARDRSVESPRSAGRGRSRAPERPRPARSASKGVPEAPVVDVTSEEAKRLAELAGKVAACTRCALAGTRTNVVFGEGDPRAKMVFVGEAPGEREDLLGRPFVGRAGVLLTELLSDVGLTRGEVYIANVLKCRPPGNRNPTAEEQVFCYPYLIRQLDIIGPKVVVALGFVAAKAFLRNARSMGQVRGRFYRTPNFTVMPTYHPAYLLRSPGEADRVRADLRAALEFLRTGVVPADRAPA